MSVSEWSKSTVEYGRKLLDSGLDGARSGEESFLHGERVRPFLSKSAEKALMPAAIGACLFLLGSNTCSSKSAAKSFAAAFLGGTVGFAAGLIWESRRLTRCVASTAFKNMGRVRDEHWLEKHPIDYA
jgi:hypothetical protein